MARVLFTLMSSLRDMTMSEKTEIELMAVEQNKEIELIQKLKELKEQKIELTKDRLYQIMKEINLKIDEDNKKPFPPIIEDQDEYKIK